VHHGAGIQFTGNRGVTNERLQRAAADLVELQGTLSPLLTHVVGTREGADLVNRIVAGSRSDPSGAPIVRLVVRQDGAEPPGVSV
jgi:hypothetical protein